MAIGNLNFSEFFSDLSKKYIIDEKIEPREFIGMLCECQNQEFDQFKKILIINHTEVKASISIKD